MTEDFFCGKLVRLEIADPDRDVKPYIEWCHDSEYLRLMGSEPARFFSPDFEKSWMEKFLENQNILFSIITLEDNLVIGNIDISDFANGYDDGWVGIGIGDRNYWGRGYGTDAMRIMLCYCFAELNLHRISLNAFEYNERAVQCYINLGFQIEGRERMALSRDGRRWDLIYMGLLKSKWEALQPAE